MFGYLDRNSSEPCWPFPIGQSDSQPLESNYKYNEDSGFLYRESKGGVPCLRFQTSFQELRQEMGEGGREQGANAAAQFSEP